MGLFEIMALDDLAMCGLQGKGDAVGAWRSGVTLANPDMTTFSLFHCVRAGVFFCTIVAIQQITQPSV